MPKLEPHTSVPKVVRNPFILSFKNIMLGLLIGTTLISSGIAGFYYFELRFTQEDPVIPVQRPATSSAKPTPKQPTVVVDETEGWKTRVNRELKYSIKYPLDWITEDCEGSDMFGSKEIVKCNPASDTSASSVSIYRSGNFSELSTLGKKHYSEHYGDYSITEDIKIDGKNAIKFSGVNKSTPGLKPGIFFSTYQVNDVGDKTLSIQYKRNPGELDNLTIFEEMISTFKFID